MFWSRAKPSLTSLVAFFVITAPIAYVLSYAPVVRVCRRTFEVEHIWVSFSMGPVSVEREAADGSLYPLYSPVDWLIDRTPVREPLFYWAGIWGVRDAFEYGHQRRREPGNTDETPLTIEELERWLSREPMHAL